MKIVEIFCIISSYFNIISTLFPLICTQALQCSSEPSRSPCKISRRARVRAGHRRCQFAFRCQFGFQVFNVCLRYQARTAPTLIRHSDSTKSRPVAAAAAAAAVLRPAATGVRRLLGGGASAARAADSVAAQIRCGGSSARAAAMTTTSTRPSRPVMAGATVVPAGAAAGEGSFDAKFAWAEPGARAGVAVR